MSIHTRRRTIRSISPTAEISAGRHCVVHKASDAVAANRRHVLPLTSTLPRCPRNAQVLALPTGGRFLRMTSAQTSTARRQPIPVTRPPARAPLNQACR